MRPERKRWRVRALLQATTSEGISGERRWSGRDSHSRINHVVEVSECSRSGSAIGECISRCFAFLPLLDRQVSDDQAANSDRANRADCDRFDTTDASVLSAQSLKAQIGGSLKGCPSDTYVVVSQPGVSANDLSTSQSTPHLRRRVSGKDSDVKSVATVNNVIRSEAIDTRLIGMLMSSCGAHGGWSTLSLDGESAYLQRYLG